MAQNTFDPSKFTTQKAKPLPVILLLDTSGSMNIVTNPADVRDTGQTGVVDGQRVRFVEGGITRISSLNSSVRKMFNTFSRFERDSTELLVSIITFGADTRMILPPTQASNVQYNDLQAAGETPLGQCLGIAKRLIEDKNQIPSRAYRPLVVLVSDGMPNDSWQAPLEDFIHNGRTAKCDRMALAIGDDADRNMLAQFIEGTGRNVFEADTADQIANFFKFVTMSTVARSQSKDPNVVDTSTNLPLVNVPEGSGNTGNSGSTGGNPDTEEEDDNIWEW